MWGAICSLCLGMAKTVSGRQVDRLHFITFMFAVGQNKCVDGRMCNRKCSVRAGHSMLKSSPVYFYHVGPLSIFIQCLFFCFLLFGLDYFPDSPIYFLPIYFIFALFDDILSFQDGVPQRTKTYYYYCQIDFMNYLYVTQSHGIIKLVFAFVWP